nr:FAD-dependent oxidoreductase [Methyloferula stellata]
MNSRLQAQLSSALHLARGGLRLAAPFVDLWARLCLAEAFFLSGLLKVGNWPAALELARYEYPVSWLNAETASLLGASIEIAGPIFLAVGLLTRPAAIAILILSLVIQFSYRQLDVNLFWAVLFGWYAVNGAGALSLDRMMAKGLTNSPLPLAPQIIAAAAWCGRRVGPWYALAMRLWLAAAVIGLSVSPAWFPVATLSSLPGPIAWPTAFLLVIGAATPLVAGLLLLSLSGMWMMGAAETASFYAALLFAMLLVFGAGRLSVDRLIFDHLRRPVPRPDDGEPHVVIVGAGFGGMACAAKLRSERVRITLIDRRNYHLFQPLLYQVATASLSPADIAAPIRAVFRDDARVSVIRATVTGVDPAKQMVITDGRTFSYDYLVLATGASHGYFGNDRWAPHAPGLKFIEDALAMRGRILAAFEQAETTDDEAERRRLLTFLICGGGPTGVELAGAIAELARHGLEREFRRFEPATARIILVQAAPRILPTFPESLSAHAQQSLEHLGVEVMLNSRVEEIDPAGAVVTGQRIPAATVLWAAGVVASPAAAWLDQPTDQAGRLKVSENLSVPAWPNIFGIGDTALALAWNGAPVPGLAPAAKQAGTYVASVIRARILGYKPPPPFRYKHRGSLATIGRQAAVADFGRIRLSGAIAWWLWGAVHISFLAGVRNRISVVVGWIWSYLTYRVGVRLITGDVPTSRLP